MTRPPFIRRTALLAATLAVLALLTPSRPPTAHAQAAADAPASTLLALAQSAAPAIYRVQMRGGGRACSGTAFAIRSYRRLGTFFVTAKHVLACLGLANTPLLADTTLVPPWGGRPLPVKNVALSPSADLAVIETPSLPRWQVTPLVFATTPAQRGEVVEALGYGSVDGRGDDLPSAATWTSGSVAWIDDERIRGGWTVSAAVVHAATTYPGDSGGPLLNLAGQVVGVNDAGGAGSYAVAIPASTARGETAALILDILDANG